MVCMIVCVCLVGLLDLKILELIKILFISSCIIKAALVGVAILLVVKFIMGK